ncbi:MAG: glycosyltransferase N-terminal domain-containing protein [Phycisphaeraceae bacterium]
MGLGLDLLYGAGGAISSPLWGYRLLRTGKWRTDWQARLGKCAPISHDRPTLLIHAVSVGEVNLIRLLVDELHRRTHGAWRIVIATTTDTGQARAQQLFEPVHTVVRYPLDFTRSVRRFLDAVRPDVVALVELEVWPNFVGECARRGVPVGVINGRLSARSFRGYRKIAALLRPTFARLAAAAVQTDDYAQRFIHLGVPANAVMVLDTMKWDTAQLAEPQAVPGREELAAAMGIDRARPLIVAGSTAPGEERLLIDTSPKDAQLMLVPRKPERFDEVAALDRDMIRRTCHPDGAAWPVAPRSQDRRLFLLDTMGELRKAYSLADVCLVGRSFLGLYGSDPIESIALGKPTIIGTHHSDFQDTVDALRQGGGIEVSDEPGAAAAALLADTPRAQRLAEGGRRVIAARQGATRRHADLLEQLMAAVDQPLAASRSGD